ncbi:MAG TPA: hypothetical protein VET23_02515, partial [Chitinophagaceae bacterium]|nr:hypothetical protein [Chitinophagaceae bacterium]
MATLRESSRKFQVVSNDGQMGLPKSVVAYFSSGLQTVFVEKDRLRIVIRKPVSKKKNLQASFAGEKPSNAIPLKFKYNSFSIQFKGSDGFSRIDKGKPFETRRNFFSSQSKKRAITNVASYEELTLKNIYKGIDLRIYSQEEGQMEFDWIIWPGADPGKIRMQFRGQQSLTLSKQDGLQIHLSMGSLFMKMPESYYATPLGKVKSNCSFVITAKNEVRFKENQKHDSRYPLIIDPNLLWGTFFDGGSVTYFDEYLYSIVYNYNNGLIYCGGVANQQVSTAYAAALAYGYCGTFHTDSVKFGSPPGYGGVGVGQQDGFIYALTKNGQTIKYITYFGGTDSDGVTGISIGGTNVFVSGFTSSSDFPVTNGTGGTTTAFSSTLGGTRDGFVAVFSDSINHLLYSTYLGGSSIDRALTIRATGSNSFYVSLDLMGSLPTSSPNYLVNYGNNSFSGPSEESWIG